MCINYARPTASSVDSESMKTHSTIKQELLTGAKSKTFLNSNIKILICSENVPPQVNGIARRIGHYTDGLRNLGHDVDVLHPECGLDKVIPHTNPWNFTAKMMVLLPHYLIQLLTNEYDIVHVVAPLNLSGMWLLAAFKIMRCLRKDSNPTLVISWHCNLIDYIEAHSPLGLHKLTRFMLFNGLFSILPKISDRILSPTKATDPEILSMWQDRCGVCYTGIEKNNFTPESKNGLWGMHWQKQKVAYLNQTNSRFLLVCVGRLSDEKGVDELIQCLTVLNGCALWLVGDGPARPKLELLAKDLKVSVAFLGYQKGEALHSVYGVADCFVCPSLTETFGQTVNEALASQVRVALPDVPVFSEAYSDLIPQDSFWIPLDRQSMACAIQKQLERHEKNDPTGVPDLTKLKSWKQACEDLVIEYTKASKHQRKEFTLLTCLYMPFFCLTTILVSTILLYLGWIRNLFGGSVRVYFKTVSKRMEDKVKNVHKKMKNKELC